MRPLDGNVAKSDPAINAELLYDASCPSTWGLPFMLMSIGVSGLQSLFKLDGSNASGGGSTALTGTLAVGALASDASNKAAFVNNLWGVQQQSGTYRYYEEGVYLLAVLHVAGKWRL